jgi:hypothetical protein
MCTRGRRRTSSERCKLSIEPAGGRAPGAGPPGPWSPSSPRASHESFKAHAQFFRCAGSLPAARGCPAQNRPASGILYTWMKMGKTVHTCLNMVQTCLYMFMHVHKFMNVHRHVHKYFEMYITCTYTFMIIYICIYMVHTRS